MKGWPIASLLLAGSIALAGCGAVYYGSSSASSSAPGAAGGPPASSASSSTPAGGGVPASAASRVTLDDNGKTITMHVGETFLLALGDQSWDVQVADQSVLARVPNVMVVRGAQGIYRALKAGTTTVTATGKPNCAAGQVCAMYVIGFHMTVQVLPK